MRHPQADTPDASARWSGRVRTGAIVVGLTLAMLAPSAPAVAHDALVSSDPPDGAVLAAAPTQVVLVFSDAQAEIGAEVVVTGADGQAWSAGAAQVAGTTVTQPLAAAMPNGAYTVTWRSVAGDGHPVTGTLGFTVDAPAPTVAATPTAAPAPAPSEATATRTPTPEVTIAATRTAAPDADGGSTSAGPWLWLAAAVVVGLVAAGLLAMRRRGASDE